MNWVYDPVDTRITSDSLVLRINKDNFEIFVGRILIDPVRVEDTEIGTTSSNSFLGSRTERSLIFELIDTLVRWFTCCVVKISVLLVL